MTLCYLSDLSLYALHWQIYEGKHPMRQVWLTAIVNERQRRIYKKQGS